MEKIKEQAFFGILWRGGYHIFHQIASLLVKILLVRLLLPADFGLVAMAMIVYTSLDVINHFAGKEPFIRDNTSDPKKAKSTLFYINFMFLGATAVIGFFSAPYVAQFFSSKIPNTQSVNTLIWIIRIFSLTLLPSIAANISMALLTKELKFNKLYISNIGGTSAYFITAPIMAFLGFGVWAIVIGHVVERIVITFLFLFFKPFVPSFIFDKKIAKNYIKYNSNIFINSIIIIIITNGDDTIIGKLMGAAILGFYNIGQQFAALAISFISFNINEIMFPVFSKFQNDKEAYSRVCFKAFRIINLLALPFIGGSIVLAKVIVLLFFGERWLPMVPVFYILSISSLLTVLISTADPVLKSLNKPHILRNSHLIQLIFFAVLIFPFAKSWGYLGVCWVMVILSVIPVVYLSPKIAKEVNGFYSYALKIFAKILPCTLVMMSVVYLAKKIFPLSLIWLFFSAIIGIVVYFIPLLFLDKELKMDIHEGLGIMRQKFRFLSKG